MKRSALFYPEHHFRPEDCVGFIETKIFTKLWGKIGLDDDDLTALQIAIMCDPQASPVMRGTSGLRKIRFSPPGWPRGANRALRVCYVFFEEVKVVVLGIVYPKGVKEKLSAKELRPIERAIKEIENELLK